ncbi:hypothetical protein D770_15310 [Flammeovirgaceae bacterium 311]|nr:hypothetical protein D770_15310 [Flammeovirgaceae bacterium 311]
MSNSSSNQRKKVAFILGAGFSKCADLPVQADLTPLLVSDEFNSPLDKTITHIISDFIKYAFGWQEGKEIPSLEDVFTSIDISVTNGTHLGNIYPPDKLRALRRLLIYRTFQILDQRFSLCEDIDSLLRHYQDHDCSYIVMNWDIVLEKHLEEINPDVKINYITPSYDWQSKSRSNYNDGIKVCKMHGSSNWAYCKNCKTLFYQLDKKLSLHKKVGLYLADFRLFDPSFSNTHFDASAQIDEQDDKCKICDNNLTTHIATFSYRKSFRTAAYSAIWHEAENLLSEAHKWVFIGYSLPEADFELKHLIKSAEIRLKHKEDPKEIEAVLYQDKHAKRKVKRFFGPKNVRVFENGLTEYVQHLAEQVPSEKQA